jgi:hypothetical protein
MEGRRRIRRRRRIKVDEIKQKRKLEGRGMREGEKWRIEEEKKEEKRRKLRKRRR